MEHNHYFSQSEIAQAIINSQNQWKLKKIQTEFVNQIMGDFDSFKSNFVAEADD